MAACTPGVKAVALCQLGDESIEEATGKIYNGKGKDGKKIDKGIAFPTCISPNHCVGHYSPLVRSPAAIGVDARTSPENASAARVLAESGGMRGQPGALERVVGRRCGGSGW